MFLFSPSLFGLGFGTCAHLCFGRCVDVTVAAMLIFIYRHHFVVFVLASLSTGMIVSLCVDANLMVTPTPCCFLSLIFVAVLGTSTGTVVFLQLDETLALSGLLVFV